MEDAGEEQGTSNNKEARRLNCGPTNKTRIKEVLLCAKCQKEESQATDVRKGAAAIA